MTSHLEKFVKENRDAFDDQSPTPELWEKIRDRLQSAAGPQETTQETPIRSLTLKRWLSAAAAVVLLCVSGWLYYARHKTTAAQPVAQNVYPQGPAIKEQTTITLPADSSTRNLSVLKQTSTDGSKKPAMVKRAGSVDPEVADYKEEMYHYARLVEIKHNELKALQKDEPLLYKKFSGDVNRLDSVYQALKTQLPENPNHEQLIEAMISNLQLQIGLLNKQLHIIKQIKHSKKAAYEKAYRSV
ncbi:MAG: anti-sigma factor [Puia sp.]